MDTAWLIAGTIQPVHGCRYRWACNGWAFSRTDPQFYIPFQIKPTYGKIRNSRLQDGRSQTNGWHHSALQLGGTTVSKTTEWNKVFFFNLSWQQFNFVFFKIGNVVTLVQFYFSLGYSLPRLLSSSPKKCTWEKTLHKMNKARPHRSTEIWSPRWCQ